MLQKTNETGGFMTMHPQQEYGEQVVNMISSLHEAIHEAGGNPAAFGIERLKAMSVMDLIYALASNHVKFIYSNPGRQKALEELAKQAQELKIGYE